MPGALYLSAISALRSGVGKLTVVSCELAINILAPHLPEAMWVRAVSDRNGCVANLPNKNILKRLRDFTAVAIGPGLGEGSPALRADIRALTRKFHGSIIFDADGLRYYDRKIASTRKGECVVTPHDGEFERIFHTRPPKDLLSRKKCVNEAAHKNHCVVLLKGNPTLVSNLNGVVYRNSTGNPGMATAGSGDVLTGVIGSLMAQGWPAFTAAQFGAYVHGKAGDLIQERSSQTSLIASDLPKVFPDVFKSIEHLDSIQKIRGVNFCT